MGGLEWQIWENKGLGSVLCYDSGVRGEGEYFVLKLVFFLDEIHQPPGFGVSLGDFFEEDCVFKCKLLCRREYVYFVLKGLFRP